MVEAALEAAGGAWVAEPTLPWWPRRGVESHPSAEACIRCSLEEDSTIGFFLCAFRRLPSGPAGGAAPAKKDAVPAAHGSKRPRPAASEGGGPTVEQLPRGKKQKQRKQKKKQRPATEGANKPAAVADGQRPPKKQKKQTWKQQQSEAAAKRRSSKATKQQSDEVATE